MSGQVVLTDAEMEALQKCVQMASEMLANDPDRLSDDERTAALRAYQKFNPHLQRKCRRRPRR